jgi:hypothetical protein
MRFRGSGTAIAATRSTVAPSTLDERVKVANDITNGTEADADEARATASEAHLFDGRCSQTKVARGIGCTKDTGLHLLLQH